MKWVALFLVFLLLGIFYPTYNLYLKVDVFSDEYEVQETRFLSRNSCHEAAALVAKNKPYHCYKTSGWKNIFGGYTRYNPAIRETQNELSGQSSQ